MNNVSRCCYTFLSVRKVPKETTAVKKFNGSPTSLGNELNSFRHCRHSNSNSSLTSEYLDPFVEFSQGGINTTECYVFSIPRLRKSMRKGTISSGWKWTEIPLTTSLFTWHDLQILTRNYGPAWDYPLGPHRPGAGCFSSVGEQLEGPSSGSV